MMTLTSTIAEPSGDKYFRPGSSVVHDITLTAQESQIKRLLVRYCDHFNSHQPVGTPPLITRITGGWVRDKLLGRESHDLDIATNLVTGSEFADGLNDFVADHASEFGIEPRSVHKIEKNPEKSKHLETATTKLYGLDIDFVNLRGEEYANSGSADNNIKGEGGEGDKSKLVPTKDVLGEAEEDAYRRDATLNALFYNLQESKIEDLTGQGLRDLKYGILRTPLPPIQTFTEDPLRVVRLIRFACTFGFQVDSDTLQAMRGAKIQEALRTKISKERVGLEISKALLSSRPQECLALIADVDGLYHAIFSIPELSLPQGLEMPKSNLHTSLQVLELVISEGPTQLTESLSPPPSTSLFPSATAVAAQKQFQLHFWLAVLLNPWEGITVFSNDKRKRTCSAAEKVIQDGIKLSINDAHSVAKAMALHASDFAQISPTSTFSTSSASPWESLFTTQVFSRPQLGLLLRRCGENWRLVLLYSLFKDIIDIRAATGTAVGTVLTNTSQESGELIGHSVESIIFQKYQRLLFQIESFGLADVHLLKPILNGKILSELYQVKGGQWAGKALQHLIEYQLEFPTITKEEAIAYMTEKKSLFF